MSCDPDRTGDFCLSNVNIMNTATKQMRALTSSDPLSMRIPRFGPSKRQSNGSAFPAGPTSRYPFQFLVEIARNPLAMMIAMHQGYGDIAHYKKIGRAHV